MFEQRPASQDGFPTLPLEMALVETSIEREPVQKEIACSPKRPAEERPGFRRKLAAGAERQARPDRAPLRHDARSNLPPPGCKPTARPRPRQRRQQPAPVEQAPPIVSGDPLPEVHWDAIRKAMKLFKGQRYNIGALLMDCNTRYVEEDSLVLVFKNRPNMERMQGELENPDTRRRIQQAVQEVTGTLYNLNLRLADQPNAGAGTSKGHLVRAALSMGARIVEEEENTSE